MKFGLMVSSDDPPELGGVERIRQHVERAVTAREAGFDTIAVAHRYSFGPAHPDDRGEPLNTWRLQPLLLLSHLAAVLGDDVHYATTVLLSASAHPVQLAEDVATLDAMTGGRLILGLGLGWMPYEFEAFEVRRGTRAGRLEELVTALRLLLSGEEVDFQGRHFRFHGARLLARPLQQPTPPIWLGASADAAVRRAARLADTWTITAHADMAELVHQDELYREERERLGLPQPAERPMSRMVYVAKDRETALAEARPALAAWYRKRGRWGWFLTQDHDLDEELLGSGRWVIGSPEDCVEQIARIREQLGITQMIFAMPWPSSEQAKRLRTIELLGEHVLPHFRDAVPRAAPVSS